MILKARYNPYIPQLCVIAWLVLCALPVLASTALDDDRWLLLCTQKGVQVVEISSSQAGEQSDHMSESCSCTSEIYNNDAITQLNFFVTHVTVLFAVQTQVYSALFSKQNPRAPPLKFS
jgi:hypothetical protein